MPWVGHGDHVMRFRCECGFSYPHRLRVCTKCGRFNSMREASFRIHVDKGRHWWNADKFRYVFVGYPAKEGIDTK